LQSPAAEESQADGLSAVRGNGHLEGMNIVWFLVVVDVSMLSKQ
jgi:hypothetical protein